MVSRKSNPTGGRKKRATRDPTPKEVQAGMALRVRERKLRDALLAWANLPLERRRAVVSYWMDEVREQLDIARTAGDTTEATDARRWAEENLVVVDLLNAIVPTPLPRRRRSR